MMKHEVTMNDRAEFRYSGARGFRMSSLDSGSEGLCVKHIKLGEYNLINKIIYCVMQSNEYIS